MYGAALLSLGCVLLVVLWPDLDPEISRWFYSHEQGFSANAWWLVQLAYHGTPWLGRLVFAACTVLLFVAIFFPRHVSRRYWRRSLSWVLVMVVGVGLVVHEALKNQMGRPRPVNVQIFGGALPYIPALQVSEHCARNCSFVSGHAAGGFSLMAWGIFAPWRRRRVWLAIACVAGGLIGLVRMAQGGHYLSDVAFAGLAIWWSQCLIRSLWLRFKWWSLRQAAKPMLPI
jgi:lipid A 4'-phosphatase